MLVSEARTVISSTLTHFIHAVTGLKATPPSLAQKQVSEPHKRSVHPTNTQRLTILLQEVQRIPIALLAHIPQHLWAEAGKSRSFGDCLAEQSKHSAQC